VNYLRAALALATLFAFALARRAPSTGQRAIAWTLAALFAIDLALPPLLAWPEAYASIWCAFYAATSAGVLLVLVPPETPPPRHVVALRGALILAGLFVLSTLAIRAGRPAALEQGAFALSLCIQLIAAGLFVSRWKRPDDAQIVALILAGSTLGDVAGAWWYSDPVRDWGVGQIQALLTWAAIAAWEGRCLIRARR
jgi:hypothetical protein